jgi:hypothetical protein
MIPACSFAYGVPWTGNDVNVILEKAHLSRRDVQQAIALSSRLVGGAASVIFCDGHRIPVERITFHLKSNGVGRSVTQVFGGCNNDALTVWSRPIPELT